MMLGAAALLNGVNIGAVSSSGRASRPLLYMFFGWFGTVIGENQAGMYNAGVDRRSAWG